MTTKKRSKEQVRESTLRARTAKVDLRKNPENIPRELQRKTIAYRVDRNTTICISAELSEQQRNERFKRFCIEHRLGDYKSFIAEQAI
jgi:hypothetical protein